MGGFLLPERAKEAITIAITVLKNCSVVYNSVDLSDHVVSVELPFDIEKLDSTAMGANTKHSAPGLRDHGIKITFLQDYATNKVDQTIGVDAAANPAPSRTLVVKPDSGAVAATNPSYTATVFVSSYAPIAGSVGELQQAEVELAIASGDLARATS